MKSTSIGTCAVVAALVSAAFVANASAQPAGESGRTVYGDSVIVTPLPAPAREPRVEFVERDLSGPRIGVMFAGGDPATTRDLRRRGLGNVISQFGWHFEHHIKPIAGGPQLVTEAIPLVAGVEYGKLIPSLTLAIGMRLPSGIEFGMGPSFTATGAGRTNKALVLAAGKTIDYGGVSLPLNVALSTNTQGARLTLIAGYAIRTR